MIKYLSTRDNTHTITSSQAIINGLAEDGGLYIPENLEDLKLDYHEVIQQDYPGMAETVFGKFFSDFDEETIEKVVSRSYTGKFSTEEITPLTKVEDAFVLELYHGPTCAFKDVALSALPNLMVESMRMNSDSHRYQWRHRQCGTSWILGRSGHKDYCFLPGRRRIGNPASSDGDAGRQEYLCRGGSREL